MQTFFTNSLRLGATSGSRCRKAPHSEPALLFAPKEEEEEEEEEEELV